MDFSLKEYSQPIICSTIIYSGALLYAVVTGIPDIPIGCILADALIFGSVYFLAESGMKTYSTTAFHILILSHSEYY